MKVVSKFAGTAILGAALLASCAAADAAKPKARAKAHVKAHVKAPAKAPAKAHTKTHIRAHAKAHVKAPAKVENQPKKEVAPVLNFTMKSLEGKDVDLSKYAGRVVLIVNTASKCGNTPQYAPLEKLHEQYGEKGLSVLGFPANDFGSQEPGTEAEISTFCQQNFGVKFDMFSKIAVKGENQAPLYKFLTSEETNPKFAGDITWNFEKFLIGRNGEIAARFSPKTKPDAPEVVQAIEAELAK